MYASEFCNVRYAVIEARWAGRPAERFTVEYYSEESLRELITAPNIIESGFLSRQDAVALVADPIEVDPNARSRTEAGCESTKNRSSARPGTTKLENRFNLQRIWMVPGGLLNQLASAPSSSSRLLRTSFRWLSALSWVSKTR
jgi:hypothetical protein